MQMAPISHLESCVSWDLFSTNNSNDVNVDISVDGSRRACQQPVSLHLAVGALQHELLSKASSLLGSLFSSSSGGVCRSCGGTDSGSSMQYE